MTWNNINNSWQLFWLEPVYSTLTWRSYVWRARQKCLNQTFILFSSRRRLTNRKSCNSPALRSKLPSQVIHDNALEDRVSLRNLRPQYAGRNCGLCFSTLLDACQYVAIKSLMAARLQAMSTRLHFYCLFVHATRAFAILLKRHWSKRYTNSYIIITKFDATQGITQQVYDNVAFPLSLFPSLFCSDRTPCGLWNRR